MKGIGMTLIILGVVGIILSFMMYGDIAIAGLIGSISSLVTGIGFMKINKIIPSAKP
ncbi:hypothetical protein [Halalkalibacillus sediminis]|uniref:hypothetical protein n=1 Tax=Halalkalibacillus sediminis TaxID=2018042 RepID=UPI00192E4ED9|nr:hypothetical protein [Halalkalibacillus sediminis]